jgi:peptidyl-prolyl cis-trans isomerase D
MNLAQAAQEIGLSVATATDLQRGKQAGFVPVKVVDVVFRTPKGAPGTAEGEKPTERFIFRVTDVVDPTLDASSPQSKAINDTLQNSYVDDIVNEFVGRLENDFGVNVNPAALNQATGGGAQQ